MSSFNAFLVFATRTDAQAYADLLTLERITDEQRANGTTEYTAPIELEDGGWALQVEADVEAPVGASHVTAVQTKIVPFPS